MTRDILIISVYALVVVAAYHIGKVHGRMMERMKISNLLDALLEHNDRLFNSVVEFYQREIRRETDHSLN